MSYAEVDIGRLRAKCMDAIDELKKSDIKDKTRAEVVCYSLLNLCQFSDKTYIRLSREDAYWLNYVWTGGQK